MATWSAPVRYAEVDQQGIVFNSHYLLYCDEAMGTYCDDRGMRDLAEKVHLVASSLTWRAPAKWGDVIEVDAACTRLGTSSFVMHFDVRVGDEVVCAVDTTYVLAQDGRPQALPDHVRAMLAGGS